MASRGQTDLSVNTHNQIPGIHQDGEYKLLRKAGVYEVAGYLLSRNGVQPNILVSANYTHPIKSLTTTATYRALVKVISEHPALSTIGITKESRKKAGNHRLWEARLPSINLEDCVEFVWENTDSDVAVAEIYGRCHNEWFDTEDKTKPWWKLVVVNKTWAIFVYHHNIGDGTSGYAFHRSFLSALNVDRGNSTSTNKSEVSKIIPSSTKLLQTVPTKEIDVKISWLHLLTYLIPNYIRIFLGRKHVIFSDITQPNLTLKSNSTFNASRAVVTCVKIMRLSSSTMRKCLSACRTHRATFTTLLHTLIQATLAIDLYPLAKVSFSRLAVSIRPFLRSKPGPDVFTNAASMYYLPARLSKFRACGPAPGSKVLVPKHQVDCRRVWELAREYKKGLNKVASEDGYALQDFMSATCLGEDDEEVAKRYNMLLFQGNSFMLSNLGVFDPARKDEVIAAGRDTGEAQWTIEDVGFSAGALKAGLADYPLSFNVASMKCGDCVITVSFEKGVLGEDVVERLLNGVEGRLKSVLDI